VNCRHFSLAASLLIATVLLAGCSNGPFSSQSADVPEAVSVSPNDPFFTDGSNYQWYLNTINAPGAWGLYEANAGVSYASGDMRQVIVSVIDGGIVAGHEDLAPVLTTDGIYLVGGVAQATPEGLRFSDKSVSHGTHVSGLIAARGGNGRGIVGATYNGWPGPMFFLRSVAALVYDPIRDTGVGTVPDVVAAILYSAGIDTPQVKGPQAVSAVLNMSLGAPTLSESDRLLFENAVGAAVQGDSVIVSASGNEGLNAVDFPARFDDVIAVGSIDKNLERSTFSNYGVHQELVAPGSYDSTSDPVIGLVSAVSPDGYAYSDGTSMSAPLVAAAAAMVRSANPYLSAAQVRQILRDTARDLEPAGWDAEFGYGLVDMEAALRRALSEPYGRYSSSSVTPSRTVVPEDSLSPARQAEYDRARAEAFWDGAGPDRITLLLAAETDVDALVTETTGRLLFRANLPDGIMVRLALDGATAEQTFGGLRDRPGVLLVSQDRPGVFLHSQLP
jgi:subtilisin family serine protease